MTKSKIQSYVKPMVSAASGVSEPTIEYFGYTVNELMNIDNRTYNVNCR